jgi:hypothetical protein
MAKPVIALLLCGLLLASAAGAQDVRRGGPAAGAATRSVSKYLGLERGLQQALDAHDRGAVSAMLDADFQLRSAASPDPLSQAEWWSSEWGATGAAGRVRDLSVFETDDLAVASFLLETRTAQRKNISYFIVDVWRASTGKLQARYVDTPARPPARQLRPDGRE